MHRHLLTGFLEGVVFMGICKVYPAGDRGLCASLAHAFGAVSCQVRPCDGCGLRTCRGVRLGHRNMACCADKESPRLTLPLLFPTLSRPAGFHGASQGSFYIIDLPQSPCSTRHRSTADVVVLRGLFSGYRNGYGSLKLGRKRLEFWIWEGIHMFGIWR